MLRAASIPRNKAAKHFVIYQIGLETELIGVDSRGSSKNTDGIYFKRN
jgi:hypothetical protein